MASYPQQGSITAASTTQDVKTLFNQWQAATIETDQRLQALESILTGGAEGQLLAKASGADYDFAWIDQAITQMTTLPRPILTGATYVVIGGEVTFTADNISDLATSLTWLIEGEPVTLDGSMTGTLTNTITVRWDTAGVYQVKVRVNGNGTTYGNSAFSIPVTVNVIVQAPGNDDHTVFLLHSDTTTNSVVFKDTSKIGRGGAQHPILNHGVKHTQSYSFFGKSSMLFDGVSYLQVPGHSDFTFTGDFSIELRVRPTTLNAHSALFSTARPGYSSRGITCYATHASQNAGKMTIGIIDVNDIGYVLRSTATLEINKDYHIEISRAGGILTAYVNGVGAGSLQLGNVTIPNDSFIIGADGTTNEGGYPIAGYIEEVRVTKGIARHTSSGFAPAQVHYNPDYVAPGNDTDTKLLLHFDGTAGSSQITDASVGGLGGLKQTVNNYGVTITNSRSMNGQAIIPRFGTGEGTFTGGGYLSIAATNDTIFESEWAIDFYLATTQANGSLVVQWRSGGGANRNIDISVVSGHLNVLHNRSGVNYNLTSPQPVSDGILRHIAVSYALDTMLLFIDGKEVARLVTGGESNASEMDFCIGVFNAWEGIYFDGILEELRFSNGHSRYLCDFVVPTTPHTTSAS